MRTPYIRKFWTLVFIDLLDWEDAEKTIIGWCRERFPNPKFPTLRLPLTGDAFVGGPETERDTPRMFPTTRRKIRAEEPSSFVAVEATTNGDGRQAGGLVEARPVTAELTSVTNTEEPEDEEWISSDGDALPLIASNRPLPVSCPEFPKGGSRKEIAEWHRTTRVAEELAENGCFLHYYYSSDEELSFC
jgi:hypothetical protein